MKTINKSLLIAALGAVSLGFISCNNDKYLEVNHYDILPADVMFTDQNHALSGLNGIYDCLFPDGDIADGWNYKPQLFLGCHPVLDTQATGWDVNWGIQNWSADEEELRKGWQYAYRAIDRCNVFLAGLESSGDENWEAYKSMRGQAKALRAYFYIFLAQNWGKVPTLSTGETYVTNPEKAAVENDLELWDFIIEDLKDAANDLDWTPYNNEYGRATKGMALSYLGEAYLWKAFRARANNDEATSNSCIKDAKDALEQVVNSGIYELNRSYSTLWDGDEAWSKEAVWQVVMDMGKGNYASYSTDAHSFVSFFSASTNGGGGWGSQYNSWELYFLFEKGDKRRDYSFCTSPVAELPEDYRGATTYGYNPFVQCCIGHDGPDGAVQDNINDLTTPIHKENNSFMFFKDGEFGPAVWSMKYWRLARCQWDIPHSPAHFYYKRYSGVLLDYAECLFRLNGENDEKGWEIIDQIRNRAFGNLEVGHADELTAKYTPYYRDHASEASWGYSGYDNSREYYPVPFSTETAIVPKAKDYYTDMTNNGMKITLNGKEETLCLPFSGKAKAWEVALLQERRKEFNQEWNLKHDLFRSNILKTHIECDYPKGVGLPKSDPNKYFNWHYYRDWEPNEAKYFMPIPTDELLKNKLLKQNPIYTTTGE
ncbi:MAG: RagB/SusD family nutrient uptake outer membrane protein [Prevotella sp.]|nr:RagB/SusD family nutrient uptake outer membrane protein [Prevotella sp.]